MSLADNCPRCGKTLKCLAGYSAHPLNWYCPDDSEAGCGWAAWNTDLAPAKLDDIGAKMNEALYAMEKELIIRWRSDAQFLRNKDPRPETAALIASAYDGCANALELLIKAAEKQ